MYKKSKKIPSKKGKVKTSKSNCLSTTSIHSSFKYGNQNSMCLKQNFREKQDIMQPLQIFNKVY